MKKLSIITPCYNEESGIENLENQLTPVVKELEQEYDVELIFVDDGSVDKTNELLHKHFAGRKGVKIIKHEKNMNLGAALRTGFTNASGDLIATIDSDCTFPPELIPPMLEMMDEKTDIVTVSPYHPQGTIESTEKYRIFLSKLVSFMYRLLLNSGVYTHGALTRVYRKEVVDSIKFNSNNFLSVTEMMAKAVLHGYKVRELPTDLNKRKFGQSKMKLVPVIKSHLHFLAKIASHRVFKTKL